MEDKRKYADRRQYLINAVSNRRRKIRSMAIDYRGGKCALCGYNRCQQALEFHHLNKNAKDFGIFAKGYSRSWNKVKQEIDKCIIVCSNCHREIHADDTQLSKEISK